MKPSCNVATLIERYFTERLMRQRNVSANTIASYRDTFRLLFTFAQARLGKPPSALALDDLDVPFISAFLADLETKRGASGSSVFTDSQSTCSIFSVRGGKNSKLTAMSPAASSNSGRPGCDKAVASGLTRASRGALPAG